MSIEGQEVQAKDTGNIFNKVIVEKFPNIEKKKKSPSKYRRP
jgi:hypothetical protein